MPACVFMRCKNHSRDKNKKHGISFHIFPHCARCKTKWIAIIRKQRREPKWAPSHNSRVCSSHFKESDMYLTPNGLKKIRKGATPSLELLSDCPITDDSQSKDNTCCKSEDGTLENTTCCWQEDLYFKFIGLYRSQECLWNPASAAYREAGARAAALAALAAGMQLPGFTATDAEKKIKYIRANYTKEIHRIEEALSAGTLYRPGIEWFELLNSFLRDIHAGGSVSVTQDSVQHEIKVEFSCDDEDFVDQDQETKPIESVSWTASEECTSGPARAHDEDEFAVFARHVAAQLRALPLANALAAQRDLQDVLTRHRLDTLHE